MKPLHIVQAAAFPFPSPQGSQVYVRGMARALARRGHRVTVACYGHGEGEADPDYSLLRTPRVPGYDNMRAGPDLIKPILDLALAARLLRQPADLVHAHNYEAPVAAALARLFTGVPIVYNAHNTMGEELHTYFRGRLARGFARRLGRALDRTVPRLGDHALAISPGAVGTLQALGCRYVSYVPPGVDPEDLPLDPPADLPPGPWVVYAGNPDAYQDLDVLVEAMRAVPQAGLLMVSAASLEPWRGCGLPRLALRQTANFAEVRRYLRAATVAALPRSTCSGYPIKLLNYLGMGLPVAIAQGSAQGLPGEVVVPNRDPAALAQALRGLLDNPGRCVEQGARARAHVMAACTWEARALELEAVYQEVLGRGRDASRLPRAV